MLHARSALAMKSIELMACSPWTPPAVATRPIGLLDRYGGSRSASKISQSIAFLNEPLTEPWYVGVLQIRASQPYRLSANSAALIGIECSAEYSGRSRSRIQIR